jgi:cell division protein FtsA
MKANHIVGLDIGTTRTCVVIAEVEGEQTRTPTLRILGVGQSGTGSMRRDAVAHIEEATESIRQAMQEAELMAGVAVDRVYAGIGGDHMEAQRSTGVVAVHGGEVTAGDLLRVHEVARAFPIPPDRELLHALPREYRVDLRTGVKDPVGMSGTRLETDVYMITCASSVAANIRKAVSRAGYRVQGLVLQPLASARAVLTDDEREVGVAMIEIGGGTTSVVAWSQGQLQHVGAIPFGGTTVTQDLVRGLSIPFAEARRLKETVAVAVSALVDPRGTVEVPGPGPDQTRHVSAELVSHIVEARLDELLGMARDELGSRSLLDTLGAGFVLTGGSSVMQGMVQLAQQSLGAPVRVGVPREQLTGLADAVARPRFATAVGLCLHGLDHFIETGEGSSTVVSGVMGRVGAWLREFF